MARPGEVLHFHMYDLLIPCLRPGFLELCSLGASWEKNLACLIALLWLQGSQGDSKNAKKKNNKKTNKNKSSISRANKKKPSMPNVSNDLSQKLYATMEKHKEVVAWARWEVLLVFWSTESSSSASVQENG